MKLQVVKKRTRRMALKLFIPVKLFVAIVWFECTKGVEHCTVVGPSSETTRTIK